MWAIWLGIAVLVLPELIYSVAEIDTNPRVWWFIGLALLIFGGFGRLVDQGISRVLLLALLVGFGSQSDPVASQSYLLTVEAQEAATLEIALPFIARWEGKRNAAYLDIVGVPTICFGSTHGVKMGQYLDDPACLALLRRDIIQHRNGWLGYVEPGAKAAHLPPSRDAAYTSFAFNVGIRGAGKSTATRRLNAGSVIGGCKAIGWWNKAGGRVVRGLVNRRADEVELCLRGTA
jgi:GH24 family phage-related lysozyme (muramidase)